MTQPTIPATEVRADQLKPGDWVAELIDGDPWEGRNEDAEVLFVHPYADEVRNSRVLLVAVTADDPSPRSVRLLAESPVRLLNDAERAAMREQAERAEFAAGLHEFADWVTANPWAPTKRVNGFRQSARLQIDLFGPDGGDADAATVARVRDIAVGLGVKVDDTDDDRTSADATIGSVSYSVIAWHRGGRPGFPELVAADPDPTGLNYQRELDDPTPVSPARGGPVHAGAVVAGGQLADETCHPVEVYAAEVYFSNVYREAVRQWHQVGIRPTRDERHQAALDMLHEMALAEDAERARHVDVREGEQGRVTNPELAHFLALKEEKRRADFADGPCMDPECPNVSWPHLASSDVFETVLTASGLTPAADESRGPLAGTTPVVTYFSFGYGQTDPDSGQKLIDHYVTVVAPTYEECRTAMFASRYGNKWSWDYLAGRASTTEAVSGWTEHEVIVAPGVDPGRAEGALKAAAALLTNETERGERVEVGADGCGCPITEEVRPNSTNIDGTERVEHRPGCWNVGPAASDLPASEPVSESR